MKVSVLNSQPYSTLKDREASNSNYLYPKLTAFRWGTGDSISNTQHKLLQPAPIKSNTPRQNKENYIEQDSNLDRRISTGGRGVETLRVEEWTKKGTEGSAPLTAGRKLKCKWAWGTSTLDRKCRRGRWRGHRDRSRVFPFLCSCESESQFIWIASSGYVQSLTSFLHQVLGSSPSSVHNSKHRCVGGRMEDLVKMICWGSHRYRVLSDWRST